MIRALCLLSLLSLAACGVDGEPLKPHGAMNVGIGSGGVNAGATVGVTKGPLTVGVGVF
ncbi:hypothetical protein [uncultured Tateyamaria sp.]|uniref:hypothetical protein n=1 Tax=uncultured Tateyamaria sp. TaxID=455651 RepID=UPI002630FCC3|nr:hypothetical protein [uncultured Tateyamaria sp.]